MSVGRYGRADTEELDAARRIVGSADRVAVLTGAGISTDSGIPDFRGPDGVWTRDPEAEKLSTIDAYLGDPDVRRRAWRARMNHPAWIARPNPGHLALVELERRGVLDVLATQNIDGLHLLAGSDPGRVVEVHGNMRRVRCVGCARTAPMAETLDRVRAGEEDPPCPSCGGILKSDVVFFGENLDPDGLERCFAAAERADVLLAVGSSLQVYPIAQMPLLAVRAGRRLVIVNGEPTSLDPAADVAVHGDITTSLCAVLSVPVPDSWERPETDEVGPDAGAV